MIIKKNQVIALTKRNQVNQVVMIRQNQVNINQVVARKSQVKRVIVKISQVKRVTVRKSQVKRAIVRRSQVNQLLLL